jgi:hypothetical protein
VALGARETILEGALVIWMFLAASSTTLIGYTLSGGRGGEVGEGAGVVDGVGVGVDVGNSDGVGTDVGISVLSGVVAGA